MLEVIDSIRSILPEEIKQAELDKRKERPNTDRSAKEADLMLKETEEHIKRMVEESRSLAGLISRARK